MVGRYAVSTILARYTGICLLPTHEEVWVAIATQATGRRERARRQADVGIRTRDLLLTMQVLYQLSYVGAKLES
jgi:hypothetical protein